MTSFYAILRVSFKQSWKFELGTTYFFSAFGVIEMLPLFTFRMMQQILQDWTVTIWIGLRKRSCAENSSCQYINSFNALDCI